MRRCFFTFWFFLLGASYAQNKPMVPSFMLDLLQTDRPVADVVRSLSPLKIVTVQSEKTERKEIQSLQFKIPSSLAGEILFEVQLKIYANVHNRRKSLYGIERLLQVTLRSPDENSVNVEAHPTTLTQVYLKRNTWLSVNLSQSFKVWSQLGGDELHVHLHVLNPYTNVGGGGDLEFNLDHGQRQEPFVLLMYNLENSLTRPELVTAGHNLTKRSVPMMDFLREPEDYEEETNNIWDEDIGVRAASALHTTSTTSTPDPKSSTYTRKPLKNLCRLKSLYVDFSEIQYDSWVLAPAGYEAFQCVGKCVYPLSKHLTPTKHSIIQTLVHSSNPRKAQKPCCVPTKLKPISMVYLDENSVITYRLSYEDMVVVECGCR
ncbi:bone morphogenetic protein 10-like [Neocloeon triangulifer]|uniref:bone morphogenetic protein 10-like n=1 Tax=Neocloeon triangulifer TaxID=2078957 RepID=UPI00286F9999|nr:bone morphogenetic protein 10-like [Neocloeon triangulifer]